MLENVALRRLHAPSARGVKGQRATEFRMLCTLLKRFLTFDSVTHVRLNKCEEYKNIKSVVNDTLDKLGT